MKEKEVKEVRMCQKTNAHDGQLSKGGEAIWGRKDDALGFRHTQLKVMVESPHGIIDSY